MCVNSVCGNGRKITIKIQKHNNDLKNHSILHEKYTFHIMVNVYVKISRIKDFSKWTVDWVFGS